MGSKLKGLLQDFSFYPLAVDHHGEAISRAGGAEVLHGVHPPTNASRHLIRHAAARYAQERHDCGGIGQKLTAGFGEADHAGSLFFKRFLRAAACEGDEQNEDHGGFHGPGKHPKHFKNN